MFIVFEGGDGSGQDTQADLLQDYLIDLGYKVWRTREPTKGEIGLRIKRILQGKEPKLGAFELQELMSKDREEHVKDIEKSLKNGEIVISSRYFYSTLVYGMADGVKYKKLWDLNKNFLRPDMVFYLDLDPALAIERIEKRGQPKELFERQEFLRKTRQGFLSLKNKFPEFKVIDGSGTIEHVHNLITAEVRKHLEEVTV
ncbi:dTMP kinase [candidate division Kazan bacterium]|uniref:Thymidylate kinase n=1 Tax=candidate division Kazan bacterium TaxID=2202143 RepID=A0A420ZDB9_UNCK3|nr:MAG: dTMP kinase [candidate division Kazan bacterium]